MPVKIRKLKADLRKAGFYSRPGKGSHVVWYHPLDRSIHASLAGNDGNDAKPYQIKEVYDAIKKAKEI